MLVHGGGGWQRAGGIAWRRRAGAAGGGGGGGGRSLTVRTRAAWFVHGSSMPRCGAVLASAVLCGRVRPKSARRPGWDYVVFIADVR